MEKCYWPTLWLSQRLVLSWLSYVGWDHLPGGGTSHSGMSPPTSVHSPQTCPEANLTYGIPRGFFPQMTIQFINCQSKLIIGELLLIPETILSLPCNAEGWSRLSLEDTVLLLANSRLPLLVILILDPCTNLFLFSRDVLKSFCPQGFRTTQWCGFGLLGSVVQDTDRSCQTLQFWVIAEGFLWIVSVMRLVKLGSL